MSSTQISAAKAREYINYYREDLPPGALQSAWLNKDVIDAIIALSETNALNGLRVYLAKYAEDDLDGRFTKDTVTMIVVPTESTIDPSEGKDIQSAYYNYSRLCPPHCTADEGN